MKNLKKVLAVVLTIAMMLTVAPAFAFTDVPSEGSTAEAINVLAALGLLQGYEDQTFRPGETITRAEFAAVICRLINLEDAALSAQGTPSEFTDVPSNPADPWEVGYVNIAKRQGIIVGYGDGTFGPNNPVLFEEAVKMIVCALGYEYDAEQQGGYPGGYLVVGSTTRITSGAAGTAGQPAIRGTVAKMLYNALEVPYTKVVNYGYYQGIEVTNELVMDRLNIAKVSGKVMDFPSVTNSWKPNHVKLNITSRVMASNGKAGNYTPAGEDGITTVMNNIYDETGTAKDLAFVLAVAFLDYSTDDVVIKAIVPSSKNVISKVYSSDDYNSSRTNVSNGRIAFYQDDTQTDSKSDVIRLASDLTVVKNGNVEDMTQAEFFAAFTKGDPANPTKEAKGDYEIQFINNQVNDDLYSVVYVTDYTNWMVVDTVNTRSGLISSKAFGIGGLSRIRLIEDESDYNFTITLDGKEITLADIQPEDVLNIFYSDLEGSDTLANGTVVVTRKAVEGTSMIDPSYKEIEINGVTYKYVGVDDEIGGRQVRVGAEGAFYLDSRNKVVYFTGNPASTKVGYVTYVYEGSSSRAIQARILTEEGKWVTYPFASRVSFNDSYAASDTRTEMPTNGRYGTTITPLTTALGADDLSDLADGDQIRVNKVASYSLNANNQITRYNLSNGTQDLSSLDGKDKNVRVMDNPEYKEAAEKYGDVGVTDNTMIFSFNVNPFGNDTVVEKEVSIVTVSSLVDRNTYPKSWAYNFDPENNIPKFILGEGITGGINYAGSFFVVDKDVTSLNALTSDGDYGYFLEGYQNGTAQKLIMRDDATVKYAQPGTLKTDSPKDNQVDIPFTDIKAGTVLLYATNSVGEITAVVALVKGGLVVGATEFLNPYTSITDMYKTSAGRSGILFTEASSGSTKYEFFYGYTREVSNAALYLAADDDAPNKTDADYNDFTQIYTGAASGNNATVATTFKPFASRWVTCEYYPSGAFRGALIADPFKGDGADGTFVFGRIVSGTIDEMVVYDPSK